MTYADFQKMMATYGFITTPLTEGQFNTGLMANLTRDEFYGLGCDVNAGVPFTRALQIAMERGAATTARTEIVAAARAETTEKGDTKFFAALDGLNAAQDAAVEFVFTEKYPVTALDDDCYPQVFQFGDNPDSPVETTHAQRTALFRKWKQAKLGDNPDATPRWLDFCKRVHPTFGMDGAITVQWCGMWLAIERDGYTHS